MNYVSSHVTSPDQGIIGRLGSKGTGGGEPCLVIPFRDRRVGAIKMAHKALDNALEKLFAELDEQESPKIHEMSHALFEKRSEILSPTLQGMVESVAESLENQPTATCPKCGQTLGYKRKDTKSILDWYHCAENVHKVVEAQFGQEPEGVAWARGLLKRIKRGWLKGVDKTLREMTPRTHSANDKIQNLIEYFKVHGKRMDYSGAKKEGLPIGSGGIESANKFISHKRLKLSGAWWLEGNGNNMLRIRCALYNGTFPEVLKNYLTLKRGHH